MISGLEKKIYMNRRYPKRSFDKVIRYLNSLEIGFTFNKIFAKEELKDVVPSTIYLYLKKLAIMGF